MSAAKPLPFPGLPPGVQIERAEPGRATMTVFGGMLAAPAIAADAQWLLTDTVPYSPSRFILGRYPTIEAAQADAWDRMTAHDAYVKRLTMQQEHQDAHATERRVRAKEARTSRQTGGVS